MSGQPSREGGYSYDVFISYSSKDKDWVRHDLLPKLDAAGLRVIIDYRDFEVGTPTLENIERAVDSCRHTVLVLTPNWVSSEWTSFESLLVGTSDPAARRRRLIPLKLEPCSLPARIAMLTFLDFTEPSRRADEMNRLVRGLST
jgi:hypothetical protein